MEFGPLAILALVWWVFSLVAEGKKTKTRRAPRPLPPPAEPRERLPAARGDGTQREGSRLEELMREFERAMEEASGVRRPDATPPATTGGWDTGEESEDEEAGEEVESLDAYQPEVVSHEDEANFERPEREAVALGGDWAEVQRQRVRYAEVRSKALTPSDHVRFDARIRQMPAPEVVDGGAPTSDRTLRLRQAIVWREVLGPPVALRGREER